MINNVVDIQRKESIIFIDFHNTLNSQLLWHTMNNYDLSKIQEALFTRDNKVVMNWMRGEINSMIVVKHLAHLTGISEVILKNELIKSASSMHIDTAMLKRILYLRKNHKVVLLTGNFDCFKKFTVPRLNLNNYFDLIISSSDVKLLKTDNNGKVFTDICNKFNISVKKSFLFDDDNKTCDVFSSLGGTSINVTSPEDTSNKLQLFISQESSTATINKITA